MNNLSKVYIFKITATLLCWCVPLILMPSSWFEFVGFPRQESYMFVRMLGWSYLALCVGYTFGLASALNGKIEKSPVWMGIVSNGGACSYLLYYGVTGTWSSWGVAVQFIGWASILASFLITVGLFWFGQLRALPDVTKPPLGLGI